MSIEGGPEAEIGAVAGREGGREEEKLSWHSLF